MPLNVVAGGVEKPVTSMSVIVGGVAKTVRRIEAWNGSAWKVVKNFTPAVALDVAPASNFANANSASVVAVTSGFVVATVSGGLGPYTYSWTQTGGPAASIFSPTQASTRFSMALGPGSSEDAQFGCIVTDSLGQQASGFAAVNFTNNSTA